MATQNYNWQITTKDVNGNSAQVQVTFQTAAAPLTLPAPGSVGNTVVGQNFNGAINASGGIGPNYTSQLMASLSHPTERTEPRRQPLRLQYWRQHAVQLSEHPPAVQPFRSPSR